MENYCSIPFHLRVCTSGIVGKNGKDITDYKGKGFDRGTAYLRKSPKSGIRVRRILTGPSQTTFERSPVFTENTYTKGHHYSRI